MRFLFLLLLVATVLLANGGEANAVSSSRYDPHLVRLLKVGETQERALPVRPPTVLFTDWVKSLGLKVTNTVKARYWLWRKRSVENVFQNLKLDSGLDKILDNPMLQTWATYVDLVNRKNPDGKVSMAEILIKTYGDLPVAVMLQSTRSSPKLARRLRVEQIQGWKKGGKSADEVFTLLKLDKAGADLFVSPQLNTWYNYVNVVEKQKAEAVMTSVLFAHYGEAGLDKISREANPRVRRMRFVRLWLETAVARNNPKRANGLTPDEYFRVLKLDAGIDQVLTSPHLVTWITFLGQFNARNPGKGTTMIETFTKVYGDEPLAMMLEAAKKVPKTKKVATQFQEGQFKKWIRDGKDPQKIQDILKKGKEADLHADILQAYEKFYKLHKK
ncbi:hypothetical protein V7S43_011141 [Phytophthora oleae]|uniref:RxLR effector PexRD54 WY domain-containing protein n=1 Tax=Phytophthora oleae TaxID=2107226 RepID=A0ABD3FBB5_9STRA